MSEQTDRQTYGKKDQHTLASINVEELAGEGCEDSGNTLSNNELAIDVW